MTSEAACDEHRALLLTSASRAGGTADITIGRSDFERMFRLEESDLPEKALHLLKKYNLTCRPPTSEELDDYLLTCVSLARKDSLARSREQNFIAFEEGWGENLKELKSASLEGLETAIKPKYFRGSRYLRYDNRIVVTENLQLEYELFVIARLCLFHKYLNHAETVVELGCGTCSNLLLLSTMFPHSRLVGLDWTTASSEIAAELSRRLSSPISGHVFDMFAPDFGLDIQKGSAIISIHAFEQLGRQFDAILEFILAAQPSVVVQYEPVLEFFGDSGLDRLALDYCRSRGYLEGYHRRLLDMEEDGRIVILAAYRPYLGGVFHEHSVLVWRPVASANNDADRSGGAASPLSQRRLPGRSVLGKT